MLCVTSLRAAPSVGSSSQSDRGREGLESITAGWMPMNKYKIAVLDDYQNVALESADWSALRDRADIVIDAIGGEILGDALSTLASGGSLTTLGYSAGRKTTIDVTDLIWKRASMKSFSLFAQPAEAWGTAWSVICCLLHSGAVKPIVARSFPLSEAADALRYLVEGRPFGRVVLTV